MDNLFYLSVLGVVGLFGNTIAVVVQVVLNAYYEKKKTSVALVLAEKVHSTNNVVNSTHRIVNSQRTQLLRFIASLSARIARDNPHDRDAVLASLQATKDADNAHEMEQTDWTSKDV